MSTRTDIVTGSLQYDHDGERDGDFFVIAELNRLVIA